MTMKTLTALLAMLIATGANAYPKCDPGHKTEAGFGYLISEGRCLDAGFDLLSMRNTDLESVKPVLVFKNLAFLELNNTRIDNLDGIGTLKNLDALYLDNTQVSDLSPLSGSTKIYQLSIRGTQVTDLSPIAGLTEMVYLDLRDTKITDLSPLEGFTKLKTLGTPDGEEYTGRENVVKAIEEWAK